MNIGREGSVEDKKGSVESGLCTQFCHHSSFYLIITAFPSVGVNSIFVS